MLQDATKKEEVGRRSMSGQSKYVTGNRLERREAKRRACSTISACLFLARPLSAHSTYLLSC